MTLIVVVPILVMIVGILLWALTVGKPSDAGKIMFAVGLLVTVFQVATKVIHIG